MVAKNYTKSMAFNLRKRFFLPNFKKLFSFLFLISLGSQAQVGNVIWEDNFDTFNDNVWTKDFGNGCRFGAGLCGWGNQERQYYRPENVYIGDIPGEPGNKGLVLEAKRESFQGFDFTSGKVISEKKLGVKYGMLEIRMSVPNLEQGLWPAAWMLGIAEINWPFKGEIDIMEMGFSTEERDHQGATGSSVNDYVGSNLFFPNPDAAIGNIATDVGYNKPYVANTPINDRFLLYRVYWDPTQLIFEIEDGATKAQLYEAPFPVNTTTPAGIPFTKPFYMLLNLAVGGTLPGVFSSAEVSAPLPGKMYVDYVRLHEWNGFGETTYDNSLKAENGNFGLYTDNTPTTDNLSFGLDSQFLVFNQGEFTTLEALSGVPAEGDNVLAFNKTSNPEWFGGGVFSFFGRNMSNYVQSGVLKFKIKIPADIPFIIGLDDYYTNKSEITFPAGETKYGLVRNGEWGEVTIPIADFAGTLAFQNMQYLFRIGSVGLAPRTNFELAIDDIYWQVDPALSIKDLAIKQAVLYPNPATNQVTIKGVEGLKSVSIYNINGQLVKSMHSNLGTINTSSLLAGMYFVQIETEFTQKILKLMIN